MSKNFAVLGKSAADNFSPSNPANPSPAPAAPVEAPLPNGDYIDLIRQLFDEPGAVAIIGCNAGNPTHVVSEIAGNLAAELGASGRRVLVVLINNLLRMNPIKVPDETAFIPGSTPGVWLWAASASQKIEFFKSREPSAPGNWLDALRRSFDCVVLDCPSLQVVPGVTEVAAMADAAVLAVEAGRTSKQQILQDQQALQLRGARLAGCILIQRR